MNTLYRIDTLKLSTVLREMEDDPRIFFAELQGKNIQSWGDYSAEIEKIFHFPSPCRDSIDRYLDWIRDLSWFDDEFFRSRYIFVIYDFSCMMIDNLPIKEIIENTFVQFVLPWWDGEVEKCVVGGKRKRFDVYLVD